MGRQSRDQVKSPGKDPLHTRKSEKARKGEGAPYRVGKKLAREQTQRQATVQLRQLVSLFGVTACANHLHLCNFMRTPHPFLPCPWTNARLQASPVALSVPHAHSQKYEPFVLIHLAGG